MSNTEHSDDDCVSYNSNLSYDSAGSFEFKFIASQINSIKSGFSSNSKSEVPSGNQSRIWYDLNQEINDLDDNTDVIPKHESEKRLNNLCIFIALVLAICCGVILSIYQ